MTTRRQAMGAIVGGAAAAPQAIRQVAAASANRVPGMPLPSLQGFANSAQAPLPSAEYIARLRRMASGSVDWDDLPHYTGAAPILADHEHVNALRSVSPMARNVIYKTRTNKRAVNDAIKGAIQELISMGLK